MAVVVWVVEEGGGGGGGGAEIHGPVGEGLRAPDGEDERRLVVYWD